MDEGIKARSLQKVFDKVAGRSDIKAVVFRVDSPGGSALASDLVAEAYLDLAGDDIVIAVPTTVPCNCILLVKGL